MSLPNWNGADAVYSRAYCALELMGKCLKPVKGRVTPTQDMTDLIEALNKGDEERIKGLLLRFV